MGGRGLAIGTEAALAATGGGGGTMDAQTAALFGGGSFTVSGYGKTEQAYMRRLFGHAITAKELGNMVGAMDGAKLNVSLDKSSDLPFRVEIKHPMISTKANEGMIRYFRQEGKNAVIYNGSFYLDKSVAPKGTGSRVFANQAYHARAQGVAYIRTFAMGGTNTAENGAYTWVRLGYNAPLPQRVQAKLLTQFGKSYRSATTFNQLMSKGGKDWWKANATPQDLIFDLGRGSTSFRILNSYMRNSGIKLGRRLPKK